MTPPDSAKYEALTFRVAGTQPRPQGSKTHYGKGRFREVSPHLGEWRYAVQRAAMATGSPTLDGPLSMAVVFLMPRPKAHYTPKGLLRPTAPTWHTSTPDGSKLLRSTEDALVDALLIADDSRICLSTWEKRYCRDGEPTGALITLIPLQTDTAAAAA